MAGYLYGSSRGFLEFVKVGNLVGHRKYPVHLEQTTDSWIGIQLDWELLEVHRVGSVANYSFGCQYSFALRQRQRSRDLVDCPPYCGFDSFPSHLLRLRYSPLLPETGGWDEYRM